MFQVNDDLSIYVTRGDMVFLRIHAERDGKPYTFQPGEVLRFKVFAKKNCEDVVLQKDFPVTAVTQSVDIILDGEDTKIGDVISKPRDCWYEVELNPHDIPITIIGYDEDGARVFKLFPEGADIPAFVPDPEDIKTIDDELDMASGRPVRNQVIARAFANLQAGYQATHDAVAALHVTPQMFGAIGDGVADDTAAVQMTVDYAAANNKRVHIPAGKYKLTETIACDFTACTALEFVGCGQLSSFVAADNFAGDAAFTFAVKSTNYRNLDVGNFEVVLKRGVSGIYFDEIGMSAVVHDIFVKGEGVDGVSDATYGIYANSSTVTDYRNIKIIGVSNGLVLNAAHSVHIDKCDISFCKYGVVLSGGSNISVTKCRLDENTVGLLQNSSNNILQEHRPYAFDGTFIGLTISDNRFEGNSYAGILLISYANDYLANNNVNIYHNYFTGLTAESAAIGVARCLKFHVSENTFKGTSDAKTVFSLGSVVKAEFKNNVCVLNPDGTKCNGEIDYSTRGFFDFDFDLETSQSNEKTAHTYYLRKKIIGEIIDGTLDVNDYNVIQLETTAAATVTKIADDNLLYVGKEICVLCDGNTTFQHSGLLMLKGSANVTPGKNEVLRFLGIYADGVRWIQV